MNSGRSLIFRVVVAAALASNGAVPAAAADSKANNAKPAEKLECRTSDAGSGGTGSGGTAEHGIPDVLKALSDVLALQNAVLKQVSDLELQCTRPELVPLALPGYVANDPSSYCRLDAEGKLHVIVRNQGGGAAIASKTSVYFRIESGGNVQQVTADTVPIAGFADTEVVFDVPPECPAVGLCLFKISVDDSGLVAETNESNNVVVGQCGFVIL
jgi:hypothetical protein